LLIWDIIRLYNKTKIYWGISKMKTKKVFPAFIVLALVFSLLAACSPSKETAESSDTKDESDNNDGLKGTLEVYAGSYSPAEPTEANPNPPTYLEKIVEEYESKHPGVKIKLIPYNQKSTEAFAKWKFTQFAGGQIPDIIYNNPDHANNESSKGWYIPLDEYLEKPNPYVDGNKSWKNILVDGTLDSTMHPSGENYNFPLDAIETAIFYNKEMFDKAGIKEIPKTWAEFITVSQKLDQAGFTPFFLNAGPNGRDYVDWFERQFMDMLYWEKREELNALKGDNPDSIQLTTEQFVRAYKKGLISPQDERYKESWKLVKGLSQYAQDGFTGAQLGDEQKYFVNEKVAMFEGSTGHVKIINEQLKPDFKWGTFQAIPPLTEETTDFATGEPTGRIGVIGAFANYNITKAAKERGNLDLAVDFLMFLSAPKNSGPMITELGHFVPMVKGVDIPEQLKDFAPSVARRTTLFQGYVSRLTPQFGDQYFKTLQLYLLDKVSLDEAMKQVDSYMMRATNQLIAENGWKIK
jgi:raffinose/stachyose/melibiose transport system substrate-binding protein